MLSSSNYSVDSQVQRLLSIFIFSKKMTHSTKHKPKYKQNSSNVKQKPREFETPYLLGQRKGQCTARP